MKVFWICAVAAAVVTLVVFTSAQAGDTHRCEGAATSFTITNLMTWDRSLLQASSSPPRWEPVEVSESNLVLIDEEGREHARLHVSSYDIVEIASEHHVIQLTQFTGSGLAIKSNDGILCLYEKSGRTQLSCPMSLEVALSAIATGATHPKPPVLGDGSGWLETGTVVSDPAYIALGRVAMALLNADCS